MSRSAVVLSFDFAVILEFLVVHVHINFAGRYFPRYIVGSPYDESTVRVASTDQAEIYLKVNFDFALSRIGKSVSILCKVMFSFISYSIENLEFILMGILLLPSLIRYIDNILAETY